MSPTVTLPRAIVAGLTLNLPWVAPTADPVSKMLRLESAALEAITTLPLSFPAAAGAKVTVNEAVCPGIRVNGALNPEMLKPEPVTESWEMIALDPPTLVTVTV